MKKIIATLIVLLLVGVFFFIQSKQNEKDKSTHSKVTKNISEQTEPISPKVVTEIQPDKPFTPSIAIASNSIVKKSENEIQEVEPKTEQELQREVLADIQLRLTTEMQKIPSCLENAKDKKEALACNKQLREINKEFELILGIVTDDSIQNTTNEFVWNETTKNNMIKELDASIQPMQEMFSCLQTAENDKEQEQCFEVE